MKTISKGLDVKAREVGGWPDGAVVHTVSVIGDGDNPQVMLKGAVPLGVKKDGWPKWGPKRLCPEFQAVVRLSEYRDAIACSKEPTTEASPDGALILTEAIS